MNGGGGRGLRDMEPGPVGLVTQVQLAHHHHHCTACAPVPGTACPPVPGAACVPVPGTGCQVQLVKHS